MPTAPPLAVEAAPAPGAPEAGVAFQYLPKAELVSLTSDAIDILHEGKPLRALTKEQVKNKLASIPQAHDQVKTDLAQIVEDFEGQIETASGELTAYQKKPAAERIQADIDKLKKDAHPEIVDNLEYMGVATYQDTSQQTLHGKAKTTREKLLHTTEVTVTYIDSAGTSITKSMTLAEWDNLVDQKAIELWKKSIPPGGSESEYRDDSKLHPLTRFAFRLKAKAELMGSKQPGERINKNISVAFKHSTEEPKPDQADAAKTEAKKNNEADKEMEKIYIDTVLERIGHPKGKDGKGLDVIVYKKKEGSPEIETDANDRPIIAEFHPELLKETTDVFLSGTIQLFATYLDPATQPEQRHNLMAIIYKHVQIANPDSVKSMSSAQIFENRLNQKIGDTFISWLTARGVHINVKELPDATFGDLINILSFSSACKRGDLFEYAPGGQRTKLKESASNAMRAIFGQNFNPEYENYIMALSAGEQDWGGIFLLEKFGINTDAISKQAGRIENANKVLTNIQTARKLSDDEMSKYKQILEHMANDKRLEEMAKKLGFPPEAKMGALFLLLFLPMIQGVMDTGGGGGGRQQEE